MRGTFWTIATIVVAASALGACGFAPSGAPVDENPDAANADVDASTSTSIDARISTPDAPAVTVDAAVLTAPGGACTCDAQCANDGGQAGVCIYGICMTRATGACSPAGSQAGCPAGSRCWNLSGQNVGPLCWPDCSAHTCSGTCDDDGSCIPGDDDDCNASCSTACT
jgi:hypothetical protein